MLDAGRSGGAMVPSVPKRLGLVPVGEVVGDMCTRVSMVLSDNEGRG